MLTGTSVATECALMTVSTAPPSKHLSTGLYGEIRPACKGAIGLRINGGDRWGIQLRDIISTPTSHLNKSAAVRSQREHPAS